MVWIRIGAAAGIVGVLVQSIWETGLRLPANGLLFAVLCAIVIYEDGPRPARRLSQREPHDARLTFRVQLTSRYPSATSARSAAENPLVWLCHSKRERPPTCVWEKQTIR